MRNALAAVPLCEKGGSNIFVFPVLHSLIDALFLTEGIDEVERTLNPRLSILKPET